MIKEETWLVIKNFWRKTRPNLLTFIKECELAGFSQQDIKKFCYKIIDLEVV